MTVSRLDVERYLPTEEERQTLLEAGLVRIPLHIPFQIEPVNAVLVLGDPPALIDTGMRYKDNVAIVEQVLAEHGLTWSDLGEIWLTHPHLDHFGLAGEFVERSGAQVRAWNASQSRFEDYLEHWAHARKGYLELLARSGVEPEQIERSRNSPSHFDEMAGPVQIHRTVAAQEGLWMAGRHRATMLHVPGHSPWCTAFWLEEPGILIGGDVLLERFPSNPVYYPDDVSPLAWQGLATYQKSLRRLRELPIQRVVPGHGFSFTGHRDVVHRLTARQDRRLERVRAFLQEGPHTVYAMAQAVFGQEMTRHALFLVMSESLCYLQWLTDLGEAVLVQTHERWEYHPA
ncbi:MAG: MBL fold metallo-hydrolase [Deltaproteobacteria bacterium]|nr:MAG: MBL fold metallo-hydrolase [Deltaproteobacteria bacterium]